MKIKLFSNYSSSEQLLERFVKNYPVEDDTLEFTNEENYDVAVIFNNTSEHIKENVKKIVIIQEPSWSPAHFGRNNFFNSCDIIITHDKELWMEHFGTEPEKIIEFPSFMWLHDEENYNFYDIMSQVTKTRRLSIIVSGINMEHPKTNYSKRIDLLKKILDSDLHCDIYGKGLDIHDRRFKGSVEKKHQALVPYAYSIAIENSCEKNYLTEKFIDCIMCNTVPIYYGAPNVEEIYPKGCFKALNIDSETIIEDIKTIIDQDVEVKTLESLLEAKKLYNTKYNLYEKLKEILLP